MMAAAAGLLLTGAAGVLTIATAALAAQAWGVRFGKDRSLDAAAPRPSCLVIVPAHDEAGGVGGAVAALKAQMRPGDRLLVVADNCVDDTAARAREAGAEVLERVDAGRRGKGHALAAGLSHARRTFSEPAAVVVFVDADCRFAPGGLDRLARACSAWNAPVQCRNLMVSAPGAPRRHGLAEWAFRIRNDFRAAGYARLGLPCQLFGTGMAMPWRLAAPERFATGHVAEDLLIGVETALAGAPPRYVRDALLESAFPETARGEGGQKRRWVQGHLAVAASHAPRLLLRGLRTRDAGLAAMALDLATPPLTLLAAGHLAATLAGALLLALTGMWLPFAVAAVGLASFALAMAVAWDFCGRGLVGWRELAALPRHAARVALAALGLAAGRRSGWVRADRA